MYMNKWSEQAWDASEKVFLEIVIHPFIQELMNGTLPREKFLFYLQQDSCYLTEYGKVLAAIASKLDNMQERDAFLYFASDSIKVESLLHDSFLKSAPKANYKGQSPACMLYTGFLFQQLSSRPIEIALASVLPCFWIYQKVGEYILEHQSIKDNSYQSWINTYAGEEFTIAVNKAISICNERADVCTIETQQSMTEVFLYATRMEWMFWDSAYKMEQWPV